MQDLYRNRDFIPDFDEILAETAARSREVSARAELRADIPYGPSPRQRLDLILPAKPRRQAPLHMFIHGGYWRSGRKEDHHLVAAPVLAAGGICAVATYDLMPQTRLGEIVAQIRRAAHHLLQIAPQFGADPQRLTVSGHSAGAHLASYLAALGPEEEDSPALPRIKGMLLVSGLYDLSEIPESFLKHEAKMSHAEAATWSPLASRQFPVPQRIITCGAGETAPFQDQAAAFAKHLTAQDQPVTLRSEAGCNHLSVVLELADPQTPLGACLAALIDQS